MIRHDPKFRQIPLAWMTDATRLVFRQGGVCEAHAFGKGFFQKNYSNDYFQGGQGVVTGVWNLVNQDGHWILGFTWKAPSTSIKRNATFEQVGERKELQFWIGEPDVYPNLLLQKSSDA